MAPYIFPTFQSKTEHDAPNDTNLLRANIPWLFNSRRRSRRSKQHGRGISFVVLGIWNTAFFRVYPGSFVCCDASSDCEYYYFTYCVSAFDAR